MADCVMLVGCGKGVVGVVRGANAKEDPAPAHRAPPPPFSCLKSLKGTFLKILTP